MGYYILKVLVVEEPEQPVSSGLFQFKLKGLVAIYTTIFSMPKVARENFEIRINRHFLIIQIVFLAHLRVLNQVFFFL